MPDESLEPLTPAEWKVMKIVGSSALLIAMATIGLPRLRAQAVPAKPAPAPPGREASQPIAAIPATNDPVVQDTEKPEPAAVTVVSGIVRDRDGNPVSGVMIMGTERHREVYFKNGVLDDVVKHDWLYAESGPDGCYRFEGASMKRIDPPIKEFGVFGYHQKGYVRRSAAELARSGDLTLEPWARVYGIVMVRGEPLTSVPIRFTLDATDEHSMSEEVYEYEAETDDHGRFAVAHVLAGVAAASALVRFGNEVAPRGRLLGEKAGQAGRDSEAEHRRARTAGRGQAHRAGRDRLQSRGRQSGLEDERTTRALGAVLQGRQRGSYGDRRTRGASPQVQCLSLARGTRSPARGAILHRSNPRRRDLPGGGSRARNIHPLFLGRRGDV